MSKIKTTKNPGSTMVRPLFGAARAKQVVRQLMAADQHKLQPGTARQTGKRGKRS
jgi:hypothetical protein